MVSEDRIRVTKKRFVAAALLFASVCLAGCGTRPINVALATADEAYGYRLSSKRANRGLPDTEILLTFSGGGTRAAAFSFGVLEELRRTNVDVAGNNVQLLDEVGYISGVSGGSFTALAFGLHGAALFNDYPTRFLYRDVQGEIVRRTLNPLNWPRLQSTGIGRSELAADYYDEILFENANFGDLIQRAGPFISSTSTDISTGARFAFTQDDFDLICSDLSQVKLSRAAATSSAVPIVLSPVTFNNYGGHCGYRLPAWAEAARSGRSDEGRLVQRSRELTRFQDSSTRPYLHLVDGGIADNLGLRATLERFRGAHASREYRQQLGLERLKRTLIVVVNARSEPGTSWDRSENGPGALALLMQSLSVPIDRTSFEALELLRDLLRRWRQDDESNAFPGVRLYPVVISLDEVADPALRKRLMAMPTSLSLPAADVDLLRSQAAVLLKTSPVFQRFLEDLKQQR
ncbi:hypothetical protein ASC94_10835 [Massilia sp. Root418]|nr:hypothetical protein ASC94_10835 [Massilia sp. Root418]